MNPLLFLGLILIVGPAILAIVAIVEKTRNRRTAFDATFAIGVALVVIMFGGLFTLTATSKCGNGMNGAGRWQWQGNTCVDRGPNWDAKK